MSTTNITVKITVTNHMAAELAELIEYLEENVVFAVANTLGVPADFTTMNAAVQLEAQP